MSKKTNKGLLRKEDPSIEEIELSTFTDDESSDSSKKSKQSIQSLDELSTFADDEASDSSKKSKLSTQSLEEPSTSTSKLKGEIKYKQPTLSANKKKSLKSHFKTKKAVEDSSSSVSSNREYEEEQEVAINFNDSGTSIEGSVTTDLDESKAKRDEQLVSSAHKDKSSTSDYKAQKTVAELSNPGTSNKGGGNDDKVSPTFINVEYAGTSVKSPTAESENESKYNEQLDEREGSNKDGDDDDKDADNEVQPTIIYVGSSSTSADSLTTELENEGKRDEQLDEWKRTVGYKIIAHSEWYEGDREEKEESNNETSSEYSQSEDSDDIDDDFQDLSLEEHYRPFFDLTTDSLEVIPEEDEEELEEGDHDENNRVQEQEQEEVQEQEPEVVLEYQAEANVNNSFCTLKRCRKLALQILVTVILATTLILIIYKLLKFII